jgi:polygalacturonase
VTSSTPFLHGVRIENLTVTGAKYGGEIIGLPESVVKEVTLSDVSISAQTGLVVRDAQDITFKNVNVTAARGDAVTSDHAQVTWDK